MRGFSSFYGSMRGVRFLGLPMISRLPLCLRFFALVSCCSEAVMRHDKGFSDGRRPPGFRPADIEKPMDPSEPLDAVSSIDFSLCIFFLIFSQLEKMCRLQDMVRLMWGWTFTETHSCVDSKKIRLQLSDQLPNLARNLLFFYVNSKFLWFWMFFFVCFHTGIRNPCTISRCSGWRGGRKHGSVHGEHTSGVCMSARRDAFGLWSCGPGFDPHFHSLLTSLCSLEFFIDIKLDDMYHCVSPKTGLLPLCSSGSEKRLEVMNIMIVIWC